MENTQSHRRSEALQLIGNFVSTFFVTILVIIAAFLVIVKLSGCYLFTIESASMTPAYPVDSVVLVKPVDFADLSVGDVVTYVMDESGTLVTHRVVSINSASRTVTTQGDANDTPDAGAVLEGNIVGRVVMRFPRVGAVLRVLTSDDNRPLVIGAIVVLLGGSFGWDFVKRRRSRSSASKEPKMPAASSVQENVVPLDESDSEVEKDSSPVIRGSEAYEQKAMPEETFGAEEFIDDDVW